MTRDDLNQYRLSRYNEYMERNAPRLIAIHSFLLGVFLVACLMLFVALFDRISIWSFQSLAQIAISVGGLGLFASQIHEAFKALKRREAHRD
jgi:hypothetical protein